jgi:hypothetical protein
MTAVQLKSRLIELIQKEGDVTLLKLLDKLLDRSSGESAYRAMLADGADRSEADIKAGRVHSLEDAKAKAKSALRK